MIYDWTAWNMALQGIAQCEDVFMDLKRERQA